MPLTEFLTALQGAKKELLKPERMGLRERMQANEYIARMIQQTAREIQALDLATATAPAASAPTVASDRPTLFSPEFYQQQIVQKAAHAFLHANEQAKHLLSTQHEPTFALGLLSSRIESPMFFRLLAERVAAALTAANNILVAVTPAQKPLAHKFAELVHSAGYPKESLQILDDDEEIRPLLLQHPGIRGITWVDPNIQVQDLGPTSWFEKKWQIHRGGKSTALILSDADLDQAIKGIIQSVKEGQGGTSWNISRVIVLDSIEKQFLEKLANALIEERTQLTAITKENRDKWVAKFKSQQARELVEGHPLAFLINVSNCSEEHQLELKAPVVFIMSVKYPHEMQKWINSLPNSLGVQMWGSDEKIHKLAPKLETGRVWVRGWLEQDENLFYGVKSSVFGIKDGRPFGAFFSERREFGDQPSKQSHWTE